MKFKRSNYCDSPCWTLKGRWIWADADWNTRWPFGASAGIRIGPYRPIDAKSKITMPRDGLLLDLNAPLGEPNRLALTLGGWQITLGLISWWTFRETGREGRMIHGDYVRCRPHLDGLSRYRYHKDETGGWVRNNKPEPLHWGWLTMERVRDRGQAQRVMPDGSRDLDPG